jgi:DMSO/TMAO reductase YedYZ molybdopterin-dependent catalytic subunit
MKRRSFLAALGAGFLAGCSEIGKTGPFKALVEGAQGWHRGIHRALGAGRITMAPEYHRSEVSPYFRGNGTTRVGKPEYDASRDNGFTDWQLAVTGLVTNPLSLSMDDLRALPQRTQVTRHDCVEGWSAIGEWTGPQLSSILALAGVQPAARFAVFHCADTLGNADYYESCDMDDALHPQTIIAHLLNGEVLPEMNGAPLRLRLERQLGYKHAKYLTGIELVESFDHIGRGKGGYWEDRDSGYQWYAGI